MTTKISKVLTELEFGDKKSTKMILETPYSKEVGICLNSGQQMKAHQTPYPIIVHVTEGKIAFGLEGKSLELSGGDMISLEGGIVHDVFAMEPSKIRLTLLKADQLERVESVLRDSCVQ